MPPIPSAGRCEQCRQRKKKCDKLQPSCSRCARLRIRCVGSGQQQYQFKESIPTPPTTASRSRSMTPASSSSLSISPGPGNGLTLFRASFVSALEADDCHNLTLCGGLLKEVPMRLGSNSLLDVAAVSVIHTYHAFCSGSPSIQALDSYSRALASLRAWLNEPFPTASVDIAWAVYLILMSQLLTDYSVTAIHGQGLLYILQAIAVAIGETNDVFTNDLFRSLTLQVVLESVVNPRIEITPWLRDIIERGDQTTTMRSLQVGQFARLRGFIAEPQIYELEIRHSYQYVRAEMLSMQRARYVVKSRDKIPVKDRTSFYAAYSFILSHTIVLNTILIRNIDPFSPILAEDSLNLLSEVFAVSQDTTRLRPLGASYMPILLIAAWPNDPTRRAEIEDLFDEFQGILPHTDFPAAPWRETAWWLDSMLGTPDDHEVKLQSQRPPDACIIM